MLNDSCFCFNRRAWKAPLLDLQVGSTPHELSLQLQAESMRG
jgi:hypothetical protein